MLKRRIIPCLDVKDGRVVKGINFEGLVDAGDPVECAVRYQDEGADELVFLDITATSDRRKTLTALVERIARRVFIPFTVGGGVRTVDDVRALLRAGADKVAINSAAVARPGVIAEAASVFGSQCVVLSVDARAREGGTPGWEVYTHGGRTPTGLDALEWIERGVSLGAGEVLLTSMDRDGTQEGYDIPLLSACAGRVRVPVIASGGCGRLEHMVEALDAGRAHAVLAASIFHFGGATVGEAKRLLEAHGVPVRLDPDHSAVSDARAAELAERLDGLCWDARGLLPAVVQEAQSGEVLMVAWMNREALSRTLATGRTWFWSRSRQALWNKGATSGNTQEVLRVRQDCDRDTLLVEVRQNGVACHEGVRSCFDRAPLQDRGGLGEAGVPLGREVLGSLLATIASRHAELPEGSYTTKLFRGGVDRIGKKVIEEAGEVALAAKNVEFGIDGGREELIYEVSDLIYHSMVLLQHCAVEPSEVLAELQRRFGLPPRDAR